LVFEKNAIFFAENCRKSENRRKSPEIVIITSTPGHVMSAQLEKVEHQTVFLGRGRGRQGCQMANFQTKHPNLGIL
jgi:hypothetical protein